MSSFDAHDSHDGEDVDDDHNPFHEFESEIARMSQDTDAILDSIRKAAAPTPPVERSKRSLNAILEMQKRAAAASYKGHDTDVDTDDDDDMTDDGSVPEEVKQKIQDELAMLDTKFSTDPDGISEEIRHVSFAASFTPMNGGLDDEEKVPSSLLLFEQNLVPMVVVVWAVVILILARVAHTGLLDENGFVVLPFSLRAS